MRKNFHYFVGLQGIGAERPCPWRGHGVSAGIFTGENASQLGVSSVARFNRDHVTANSRTDQGEIADDIENLVANEFVRETQRLLAHDRITAQDNRVFEAAA